MGGGRVYKLRKGGRGRGLADEEQFHGPWISRLSRPSSPPCLPVIQKVIRHLAHREWVVGWPVELFGGSWGSIEKAVWGWLWPPPFLTSCIIHAHISNWNRPGCCYQNSSSHCKREFITRSNTILFFLLLFYWITF